MAGFIIVDLDNCISDDEWRIKFIDKSQKGYLKYHTYHCLSGSDEIKNTNIVNGIDNIIVFTGRPDQYREVTIRWLDQHDVHFLMMFMRPAGDMMKNVELKRSYLDSLNIDKDDIVCAYDDNPEVIQMYKEQGIRAELVQIHPVEQYGGVNP